MVPHILIVDADASAAQVTRAVIARAIPEATIAVETLLEHAWFSLEHHQPDVLIIDPAPHSPGGAGLIQHLKAERPAARVIVVASAPNPPLRRRMEGLGVDAYLEKPLLLSSLLQELQPVLQPRGQGSGVGGQDVQQASLNPDT